jgi:hypothetical protein
MTEHPRPSTRACELVRGAYDLHVHTGPDLLPRSASDLELSRARAGWICDQVALYAQCSTSCDCALTGARS